MRILISMVMAAALASPALALPGRTAPGIADAENDLLVEVATKAQKNAAWADCRKRFGKRLVTVKFTKTQYSCQYRVAGKAAKRPAGPSASFIAAAKKKCREDGMRFLKVINKSNSGHTNIMCVR